MSSPTNPLPSSKDLTILALGETAEDKALVLDGLKLAGSVHMQDTATDDYRELRYTDKDGPAWRILDPGDRDLVPSDMSGVTAIMFVVNLAHYDQPSESASLSSPPIAQLQSSLERFATVTNASPYARTPVLLFFRGADTMAARLPSSPLERLFPDYEAATDPATGNSAATMGVSFLASRFARESPRPKDQVYAHPVAGPKGGTRDLEFVMKALEDIVEKRE
ncbi:MAG: hypothetical protein Q9187_005035 [Circinaria calcarea]